MIETRTGYIHRDYAYSLREFGTPRQLPQCGGWILERQIPGFPYQDAMGCYPLFACCDWSGLHADLDDLEPDLVSLILVSDPLGDCDPACLRRCFDFVKPFKEHFVTDLSCSRESFVSKRHRRNVRKAAPLLEVDHCRNPKEYLDQWCKLYQELIERHQIKGMAALSRMSFERQLEVPGLVMLRAKCGDETVGMLLFYVCGDVAYYHLGAHCEQGYCTGASFALFWFAIEYFAAAGLRWLSLGAGAGVVGDSADGLSLFKRGWSTETRTAYSCGRIFDHARYSEIVRAKAISPTDYFPAYRKGEFT